MRSNTEDRYRWERIGVTDLSARQSETKAVVIQTTVLAERIRQLREEQYVAGLSVGPAAPKLKRRRVAMVTVRLLDVTGIEVQEIDRYEMEQNEVERVMRDIVAASDGRLRLEVVRSCE